MADKKKIIEPYDKYISVCFENNTNSEVFPKVFVFNVYSCSVAFIERHTEVPRGRRSCGAHARRSVTLPGCCSSGWPRITACCWV